MPRPHRGVERPWRSNADGAMVRFSNQEVATWLRNAFSDGSRPSWRRMSPATAASLGLDEAGTARTLHEHRAAVDPIVAHHGGRIVKTTGDGVLLEFPSIVAAVDCAVVVQNLMRERNRDVPEEVRMLFRIGINLGDVLIDGDDIL